MGGMNKTYMKKRGCEIKSTWYGVENLGAYDSLYKYRIVMRGIGRGDEYECYLPDPDYDDCCIRVRINEISLIQQLRNQPDIYDFCSKLGIFLQDLFMMPIEEKLPLLCEHYDMIALLQLAEYPDPIPISEIELKRHTGYMKGSPYNEYI